MKNLPLSIQTFSKFAAGNYLYVDKTRSIYNLLLGGGLIGACPRIESGEK